VVEFLETVEVVPELWTVSLCVPSLTTVGPATPSKDDFR
ncbi:unnamed protein product, partial [Acidithrix sp. C25]